MLIEGSESDPNSIQLIRTYIVDASRDMILLEEILGYLNESLEDIDIPPEPPEQSGRALYERLQITDSR